MTSFDVIYSLPDEAERAAVAEMFRVLRPGGHLVINVAAMALLTRQPLGAFAARSRRYSRASLARALHAAGFEIRRISYTNATHHADRRRRAPAAAGPRAQGVDAGDLDAAAPVNSALAALLRLEAAGLRSSNMPFGSSLLALAQTAGDAR